MRVLGIVSVSCLLVMACGDSSSSGGKTNVAPGDPFADFEDMNTTVIGGGQTATSVVQDADAGGGVQSGSPILVGSPAGDPNAPREVCLSDTLCEVAETDTSSWCERDGGPVDLIFVDGVLVETICYPPADDPDRPTEHVESTSGGDINILQMANRTTVTFDEATDGMPIAGDVTVDGNNVSIYGNGPDNTIIDGDVTLDGNNTRLRGVTITGDLILNKNSVAIVLSRIMGNLRLESMSTNNSVVAETDIFGSFTSDSNGNLFVGNDVSGDWEHTGNGNTCDRNFAFSDDDGDEVIADEERGAALTCP